jgi:hypothetical protein
MADPSFFRGPAERVREMSERASLLPGEIEQAYARWTELEGRA